MIRSMTKPQALEAVRQEQQARIRLWRHGILQFDPVFERESVARDLRLYGMFVR